MLNKQGGSARKDTPTGKGPKDILEIEKYKLAIDRQKYFTDLARDAFKTYLQIFTALISGGITLVYVKPNLKIDPDLLESLTNSLIFLVAFLGLVTIGQIIFCLVRWRGYRLEELDITGEGNSLKWWWWIYEGLYCFAIVISIVAFEYLTHDIEKNLQPQLETEIQLNDTQKDSEE